MLTTNSGGLTQSLGSASGGNATAVTNAGGVFDISGLITGSTTLAPSPEQAAICWAAII